MTLLDPLGSALSLLSVFLFTKARLSAWLISLLAILINSLLYWQKGIFGHLGLEAIYFITSFYGLYCWSQGGSHTSQKPVGRMPTQWYGILLFLIVTLIPALAFFLSNQFNSDVPYWDASTTILSVIAHWMLCRKWIECWILWFFVDIMVGALNFHKGIFFHGIHHYLYLGLAIYGYIQWRALLYPKTTLELNSF